MITHRTAPAACPGCGALLEAASGTRQAAPLPGDFGACFHCGCLLRHIAGGVRRITPEDEAEGGGEVMARLQRLRQLIMDKNFIDERVVGLPSSDDARAYIDQLETSGRTAALIGTRIADGPPEPGHRPAREATCDGCGERIWVPAGMPGARLVCTQCAARFILKMKARQA